MTRILTSEQAPQAIALASFGAYACLPGSPLLPERMSGRREAATTGEPVERW